MIQDFIYLADLQGGTVMPLVNVLVNVLDGFDGGAYLDVDVAMVPCGEERIIRNDVTIVKDLTLGVGIGAAIVRSGVLWIAIFTEMCFWTKVLGEALVAFSINHAGGVCILSTAGAMGHALCDSLIQHGVGDRIRDLCGDDGIDMGSVANLVSLLQEYEEVNVRQTTLLELYGEDKALNLAKKTTFYILEHGLDLLSKDMGDQVRAI